MVTDKAEMSFLEHLGVLEATLFDLLYRYLFLPF